MPRDSFSRRVARAAASGGGRTYRARTPVSWYLVVLVICLLGVSLVAYSRYELLHPLPAATAPAVPPTAADEWQAAVAVDLCGSFSPSTLPVTAIPSDPFASIGDYIARIEPGLSAEPSLYEGHNATLGAYLLVEGGTITPEVLSLPGKPVPVTTTTTTTTLPKGKKGAATTTTTTTATTTTTTTVAGGKAKATATTSTSSTTTTTVATRPGPARNFRNGTSKCGSKPGFISVETWPSPTSKKGTLVPASQADGIRFTDGQMITVAFLPKGAPVPQPPASARAVLRTFLIEDPGGVATTTVPTTLPTTTTSSVATTTTSSPGSTTTTSSTTSPAS